MQGLPIDVNALGNLIGPSGDAVTACDAADRGCSIFRQSPAELQQSRLSFLNQTVQISNLAGLLMKVYLDLMWRFQLLVDGSKRVEACRLCCLRWPQAGPKLSRCGPPKSPRRLWYPAQEDRFVSIFLERCSSQLP